MPRIIECPICETNYAQEATRTTVRVACPACGFTEQQLYHDGKNGVTVIAIPIDEALEEHRLRVRDPLATELQAREETRGRHPHLH